MDPDVQTHSLQTLTFRSAKRGREMFVKDGVYDYEEDTNSADVYTRLKIMSDYGPIKDKVDSNPAKKRVLEDKMDNSVYSETSVEEDTNLDNLVIGPRRVPVVEPAAPTNNMLVAIGDHKMLVPPRAHVTEKPMWHAPWKLVRVISGHAGWVRCVAVEPKNEWFATGSTDRIIKLWDMQTGELKLSLTGHVSGVRGLAVGIHHPYLFSCGEDKQVKCWDLTTNKVVRHFHGHLSAVYGIDIHPTLSYIATCGRDATVRLWDLRTKVQIHCLTGHTDTVAQVRLQASEPQIISSSHDKTIRLWDIEAGKTRAILTNHKKSVRALALHPSLNMMVSGSPDNIKQWTFPEGKFYQNMSGHNAIVNCLAVSRDNVVVSGADNGSMHFWDWKSGHNFQQTKSLPQPGSLESEAGVLAMAFDKSEMRLITGEADKSIKIYAEDENATELTHPLNWKSEIIRKRF